MNDLRETVSHRTSPELKWLLNERAAVLGLLGKSKARAEALERAARRHEEKLAKVVRLKDAARREAAEKLRTLQALDVAIHLVDSRVRPDAEGCVKPWKGRYGQWGGLSDFIKETLRASAPTPISGADLTRIATAHFNLNFQTAQEKLSFKDTVKGALRRAVQQHGEVERIPKANPKQKSTLYRWKGPASLESLRMQVAAAQESEHDQAADPA